MKKGWKVIEIDLDDDVEIITAWVDGEITKEFNVPYLHGCCDVCKDNKDEKSKE